MRLNLQRPSTSYSLWCGAKLHIPPWGWKSTVSPCSPSGQLKPGLQDTEMIEWIIHQQYDLKWVVLPPWNSVSYLWQWKSWMRCLLELFNGKTVPFFALSSPSMIWHLMIPFSSSASFYPTPAKHGWSQCQYFRQWDEGPQDTWREDYRYHWQQWTSTMRTPHGSLPNPGHSNQFLLCSHPEVVLEDLQGLTCFIFSSLVSPYFVAQENLDLKTKNF